MTIIFPESVPVLGNQKLTVGAVCADMAAPKVATEINAVASLDLSLFVRDWNPDITTNTGTAPARMGTTLDLPQEGKTQLPAIMLEYVYDPTAATSTDANKARMLLVQGTKLFGFVRKGLPYTTAWASGQFAETWKFKCGRQNYVKSDGDDFAEFVIQQYLFPVLAPILGTTAT